MSKYLLFFICFFCLNTYAQRTLIPYRIVDKWGVINYFDEMVVEAKYEEVRLFASMGLARVKLNNKYGFIDQNGKVVIEPVYDAATDFYRGQSKVSLDNEYFIINDKNEIIDDSLYLGPPPAYEKNYDLVFPHKKMTVLQEDNWKDIHQELQCDTVFSIWEQPFGFLIKKAGKWGITKYGELWLPAAYDSIHIYRKNAFLTFKNGKKGLCVRFEGGKPPLVLPAEYDEVKVIQRRNYSNSFLYWYKKDGLWGFIDAKYNFVAPKYKSLELSPERNFLYEVVTKDGQWGYYLISFNKECFRNTIPLLLEEQQKYFSAAEVDANDYLEDSLKINWEQTMNQFEFCIASMQSLEKKRRDQLIRNFAMGIEKESWNINEECLFELAKNMKTQGLLTEDAIIISKKLIESCKHLNKKYQKIINEYPNYPFSRVVLNFKSSMVNSLSPRLVDKAMSHALNDANYEVEFYQKVVFLYKFHLLAYGRLVESGEIPNPFKK